MSTSLTVLRGLAAARMLVGSSTLLAPQIISPLFGIPLDPQSAIMARLFGVRDFAMGALLWRAATVYSADRLGATQVAKHGSDKGDGKGISTQQLHQRDLQLALAVGVFCDTVDVISSIVRVFEGNLTHLAMIWVTGGASVFAIAGIWQLRKLR